MTVETRYVELLMKEASARLPKLRLFRRNVGAVKAEDRFIRFALPGQGDLWGIRQGGGHLEIEVKSLRGTLSVSQTRWMGWCRDWGVEWKLFRPLLGETMDETVYRWVNDLGRR